MLTTENTKVLEAGDVIVCKGIKATIQAITFQDYYDNYGFHTEFTDTNGVYRSWKQWTDGGEVIPKRNEVII